METRPVSVVVSVEGPKVGAKSCRTCKHLDQGYDDWNHEPSELYCGKREYRDRSAELKHLEQMNNPAYLARSKVCWEGNGT